jgi:hypothetical protein
MSVITLYRPVGQAELDLVAASEYRAFPPRLPEQPIFYPVLTREYAEQIARDWNTKDERSGFVGYVTQFAVDADYLNRFEVKKVGGERSSGILDSGCRAGRIQPSYLRQNSCNSKIFLRIAPSLLLPKWKYQLRWASCSAFISCCAKRDGAQLISDQASRKTELPQFKANCN